MTAITKPNYSLREIPSGIWALGFVSMLMDVSSEMIHALLPVYLATVSGTSMSRSVSLKPSLKQPHPFQKSFRARFLIGSANASFWLSLVMDLLPLRHIDFPISANRDLTDIQLDELVALLENGKSRCSYTAKAEWTAAV